MDELKQAYETLGLPEDATREQVENRYFLLMKKARSTQSNMDEITRAYKVIVGYESEKTSTEDKQSKAAHFFYYYKFHVLAAIAAILLIVFTVKGVVDRKNEEANKPPLDVYVTVFGNFPTTETYDEQLSRNLLALVPEWKRIDVLVSYVPAEMRSQQDMALQQKGMITMMTEKMDLLVVDEQNFEMLARQNAFVPLDTLSFWNKLEKDPGRIRNALPEESTTAKPFGVDVTDHKVFDGTQVDMPGERKILAMRADPPNADKARKLMQLLLTQPK